MMHLKGATVRILQYLSTRFFLWKQLRVLIDVLYDDSDG